MDEFQPLAQRFVDFVNASPSPYHTVHSSKTLLLSAGYQQLHETDQWTLKPGGKYFYTRNQSTIFAFAIGEKYKPGNPFAIVGAHTDSPTLKLRPVSAVKANGFLQVGCETYGGGLWYTWFDRDLSVAGRVIIKTGDKFESRLVKLEKPLLRIPSLAIHLDRSVNTEGFKYNTQTHLLPILATEKLNASINEAPKDKDVKEKHHPILLKVLSDHLGCRVEDIQTFDLNLFDTQPATIGGALNEFVFAPRCDNLGMSFCSLIGLLDSTSKPDSLANETQIRAISLYDNEEVGSSSAHGAGSPMLLELIERVLETLAKGNKELVSETIRKSFLVSADMAHCLNPNYSSNYEPKHQPMMNQGPVIKYNANLRYATTAYSSFIILELAKRNNIPVQEFVVRNDSPCGSTIGPIISSLVGIRTVDIGNPQLSMHSIRETAGVADVTYGSQLCKSFFEQFGVLDAQIKID
eukprot:TRINITY_DN1797_c0_g1_i2.p1 TRINITY_DN1797_c0_g1~~TRINITY_DN1797_c0_g1_i2.p1  ORF type:complete len:464 (+),score=94.87 TRINITY_DN1797_c0_g1_i2:217-1608(+)